MSAQSQFIIAAPGPEARKKNQIIDQREFLGFNHAPTSNQNQAQYSSYQPVNPTYSYSDAQHPSTIQSTQQQHTNTHNNNANPFQSQLQQPQVYSQINNNNSINNYTRQQDQNMSQVPGNIYPNDNKQIQPFAPSRQTGILHPNQQQTNLRQTAEIHNQLTKQQHWHDEPQRMTAQPANGHFNMNQNNNYLDYQQRFDERDQRNGHDNYSNNSSEERKEAIKKDVFIKYLPYFEAYGYKKNDTISDFDALKVLNTQTVEFDPEVFSQLKNQLQQSAGYSVHDFLTVYAAAIHNLEEKKITENQVIDTAKSKLSEILSRLEEARLSEKPNQPSTLHVHVIQAFGLAAPSKYRVRVKFDDRKQVCTNDSSVSSDPVFNEDFKLELVNNNSVLQLIIENANNGQRVGLVTQKVKQFSHQRKIEEEYILENDGGVLGDSSRKLLVGIQWVWSETKLYETILNDNKYFEPLINDQEEKLQDIIGLLDILHAPFNRDLQRLKEQISKTQKTANNNAQKQNVMKSSNILENALNQGDIKEYTIYSFIVFAVLICFFKPNIIDVTLGFVLLSKYFEVNHKYIVLISTLLGSIVVDTIQVAIFLTSWFELMEYGTVSVIIFSALIIINTLTKIILAGVFWKNRQEYEQNSLLHGFQELS